MKRVLKKKIAGFGGGAIVESVRAGVALFGPNVSDRLSPSSD